MRSLHFISLAGLASALMFQTSVTQAQTRVWGTYYGGEPQSDSANAVVTTGSGHVYVVGTTRNTSGIATAGAFDSSKAKIGVDSGFIAKLDSNGKRIWGTYYGDEIPSGDPGFSAEAELMDVKLDTSSNVYVLGNVQCPSQGLATAGAFQSNCKGMSEIYVAKFSPSGQRLWGTYFGGTARDHAISMTVTPSGVYIVGGTDSTTGIASPNSEDGSNGGSGDGFVAKLDLSGTRLWSRYYGGADSDRIFDIACRRSVTNEEDCVIVGDTSSTTDIATPGAHDAVNEGQEAFIARINGANGQRVWGTYFGSDAPTWAKSVIVDSNLNIFVGGSTIGQFGLATPGAFKTFLPGDTNNFLAKFDATGKRLISTYLGEDSDGSDNELQDLAMDASGNIYAYAFARVVQGEAGTQATSLAFDKVLQGDEAVVTKFNSGLQRVWATYYGGSKEEIQDFIAGGITIGRDNHVYIVGDTNSPDGIASPGAHKTVNSGHNGFIAELAQ